MNKKIPFVFLILLFVFPISFAIIQGRIPMSIDISSYNSTGFIGLVCGNGEIIEFNSGTGLWECATDSSGLSAIYSGDNLTYITGGNTVNINRTTLSSEYVPYTGATKSLELGTKWLQTPGIILGADEPDWNYLSRSTLATGSGLPFATDIAGGLILALDRDETGEKFEVKYGSGQDQVLDANGELTNFYTDVNLSPTHRVNATGFNAIVDANKSINIGANVSYGDSTWGIGFQDKKYPNRTIGQNVISTMNLMNFGVNSPNVGGGDITNPTGVQFQLDARGLYGLFKIYQQKWDGTGWNEYEAFSVSDNGFTKIGYSGATEEAVLTVRGGDGDTSPDQSTYPIAKFESYNTGERVKIDEDANILISDDTDYLTYIGGWNEGADKRTGFDIQTTEDAEKIAIDLGNDNDAIIMACSAESQYRLQVNGDSFVNGTSYVRDNIYSGYDSTGTGFYGDFANIAPVSTFSGGVRGAINTLKNDRNIVGGYFLASSSNFTDGTNSIYGVVSSATDTHTTGTSYQVNGFSVSTLAQPNSGSPSFSRMYGGTLSSYLRPTGSSTPTATTGLGLLLQTGIYPTTDAGTVSNAQGIQINVNTGNSDNGTARGKLTTASGVLVNEPVNYGNVQNFYGFELSNRYYTSGANISNDYRGIYLEGLNGGRIGGTATGIYMTKFDRGESGNYQIYSEGGDSFLNNGNLTVNGTIFAQDYITLSDVPDFKSEERTLDTYYANKEKWLNSDGTVNHKEHPAFTSKTMSVIKEKKTVNSTYLEASPELDANLGKYVDTLTEDYCITDEKGIENCEKMSLYLYNRTTTSEVPIYENITVEGISMEDRVVALEKMIYELIEENKDLKIRVEKLEKK